VFPVLFKYPNSCSRMQEMHSNRPKFSEFSGGEYPRTPLESCTFSMSISFSAYSENFATYSDSYWKSCIINNKSLRQNNRPTDWIFCLALPITHFSTLCILTSASTEQCVIFTMLTSSQYWYGAGPISQQNISAAMQQIQFSVHTHCSRKVFSLGMQPVFNLWGSSTKHKAP